MSSPIVIESSNLSIAWCKSLKAATHGQTRGRPQLISLVGFSNQSPEEDAAIEIAIDEAMMNTGTQLTCNNVAFTIFPSQLCDESEPAQATFDRWKRAYPRLLKRASKKNSQWSKGFYFYRMIAYGEGNKGDRSINQLDHIINIWNEGVHNSMGLQISCFDPLRDHNRSRQRSFPCLHQIGLTTEKNGTQWLLTLNAFYPVQNILQRAYGNYQGLCRLGKFMSRHMIGCRFHRLNCFIAKPTRKSGPDKRNRQESELFRTITHYLKEKEN